MTHKQEDQLLVDYFKPDDTIKVNCLWLQSKLRESTTYTRNLQAELDKALRQIDRLKSRVVTIEENMPTYSLDIKV